MTGYKSIQVSAETHAKLYRMKTDLQKIVDRNHSFEGVNKIPLLTRPLEEIIQDLMLMLRWEDPGELLHILNVLRSGSGMLYVKH